MRWLWDEMDDKMNLKGLKRAFEADGFDQLEVYGVEKKTSISEVSDNKVEAVNFNDNFKVGIRALVDNRIGFSTTSNLKNLKKTAQKAIEQAKLSQMRLISFPVKNRFPKVEGLYDKKIEKKTVDQTIDQINNCLNSIKFDVVDGSVQTNISKRSLVNSCGVEIEEKKSLKNAYFSISDGNITRFFSQTDTTEFELREVGIKAESLLRRSKDRKNISSGNYDILLTPRAQEQIFSGLLYPSFNADNVQRGKSFLEGKKGEEIFSENMSIVDNGMIKGCVGTRSFDREGTTSQKTVLVDEGVVNNFLYDLQRAEKEGIKSTGNAIGGSSTSPRIGPTNIILDGLVRDMPTDKLLIIESVSGVHTANPESGDYSLNILCGFLNENGNEVGIKSGMLVGNIFDLLQNFSHFVGEQQKSGRLVTKDAIFRDQKVIV